MAQSQDGRDTVQEWVHKQKKETKKRKGKKTKEKELGLGLGLPVTTNETRDSNNAIHVITLSCVLRRQRACNLWPVHSSKGWPNSGRRPGPLERNGTICQRSTIRFSQAILPPLNCHPTLSLRRMNTALHVLA